MTRSWFLRTPWITLAAACLVLNPGDVHGQGETPPDRIVHVIGTSVPLNLPIPQSRGFLSRWLAMDLSVIVLKTPDYGRIMLDEHYLREGQSIDPEELGRLRYQADDYHPRPGGFVYEIRDRWRASRAVIALNARPRDFVSVLDEPMELTPGDSHEFRFALAPPEDGDPTTLKVYAAVARGAIDMHDGTEPQELEIQTYVERLGDYWVEGEMTLLAERTLDKEGELRLTYTYEPDPEEPQNYKKLIVIFVAEDIHGATTRDVFVAVDNGPETCAERLHPNVSRDAWMAKIPSFQESRIQEIFDETGIETSGRWTGSNREIYRGYLHDFYSARDLDAVRKFIGWFSPKWRISDSLADEFRPLTEFAAGAGDLHAVEMLSLHSSGADADMWSFVQRILGAPNAERLHLNRIDIYAPELRPWDNPFAQWSTDRDVKFAIGRKKAWRWLACHLASKDRPPAGD